MTYNYLSIFIKKKKVFLRFGIESTKVLLNSYGKPKFEIISATTH